MPFEDIYVRQITPPAGPELLQPYSAGSNRTSNSSYRSYTSSPNSVNTQFTTPPRSPVRRYEPLLLPKIRSQDQSLDPVADLVHHHKSASITSTGFPLGYSPHVSRSVCHRRSMTPPDLNVVTPLTSASLDITHNFCREPSPAYGSRLQRPTISHSRTPSANSIKNRSRSTSASNHDESIINRFAYPTYRQMPTYMTTAPVVPSVTATAHLPKLAPSSFQAPEQQHALAAELVFDSYSELPESTTLIQYLTAPNPSPSLVRRTANANRQIDMHFWWDVRNVRAWSDFSLETILSIPNFTELLSLSIPAPALPNPGRCHSNPETVCSLHDMYSEFYAFKVNAALKAAMGTPHMTIRPHTAQPGARQLPDFVSSYESDYERTIYGDGRGRVVGLVRTFDRWNTGMRADTATSKIAYLRELAHLHRHMREHSCRYGFLITEIELVCVRAGTDVVPLFGLVEVAPTIRLNAHGPAQLTAALALWYLHMLAKNTPLPGQCGWRLDVGAPAALTRQNCAERDDWMVRPEGKEKREAKRCRGWVFPEEPLSRKECGKVKRWSRS